MASYPISPRYVLVDDTDDAIKYESGGSDWFVDTSGQTGNGNFGPTFLNTSHGISSNGSLSFSFRGTSVRAYGINDVSLLDNNTTDPNWECFLDGQSIGRSKPFGVKLNNWVLCDQLEIPDGDHEFRIEITTTSEDRAFWLDYIRYVPSNDEDFHNAVVMIDNRDAALDFDPHHWRALDPSTNVTQVNGCKLNMDFVGTSVTWVGWIPKELPHAASSGTYSIDGETPIPFELPGLSGSNPPTKYGQRFFTTHQVRQGPHHIEVVYNGNSKQTPLVLDFLYILNGTATAPNAISSPSIDEEAAADHAASVGAIAGGIIAGVVLLVLLAFGVWWFLRRRNGRHSYFIFAPSGGHYSPVSFAGHDSGKITPFTLTPTPPAQSTQPTNNQSVPSVPSHDSNSAAAAKQPLLTTQMGNLASPSSQLHLPYQPPLLPALAASSSTITPFVSNEKLPLPSSQLQSQSQSSLSVNPPSTSTPLLSSGSDQHLQPSTTTTSSSASASISTSASTSPAPSSRPLPSPTSHDSSQPQQQPQVLRHQDSGLRFHDVQEVPPDYTLN